MVRLKKSLGQCFLRDRVMTRRIADAVPLDKPVLEIGPGDGALTDELLKTGHNVTAVELDQVMIEKLTRRFQNNRNFNLFHSDILKISWTDLACDGNEITVVGNLPYHLASVILFDIFELVRNGTKPLPVEMIVMVQREVGLRLTASPGTKAYGSLTLLAKYHGNIEYLFTVPSVCFRPKPKVDGAMLRFRFHKQGQFPDVDYQAFRRITRGSFAQRRKMMKNSIQVLNDLPDGWMNLDFDFTRRAEQFTFDEYLRLTREIGALEKSCQNHE